MDVKAKKKKPIWLTMVQPIQVSEVTYALFETIVKVCFFASCSLNKAVSNFLKRLDIFVEAKRISNHIRALERLKTRGGNLNDILFNVKNITPINKLQFLFIENG